MNFKKIYVDRARVIREQNQMINEDLYRMCFEILERQEKLHESSLISVRISFAFILYFILNLL